MGMESFLAPTFITHALRCRVDRETGVVRVLEAVAVHDCGVILNPIGAEGQVEGGVVMGIGEALLEGTVLSEEGRQLNAGLLDYKLQTCSDAPPITIEFVTAPDLSGGGPKGSKGVGEPPCVPTSGAVGNAIAKVIGTHVLQLPMTPDRVWSTGLGLEA
jgi:xanthine dehydrogenase molybdenum-binding subunit